MWVVTATVTAVELIGLRNGLLDLKVRFAIQVRRLNVADTLLGTALQDNEVSWEELA